MNDDRAADTKVRDRFDGRYGPRVVVPDEPVVNPDRAQLAALAEHLATDPARVAARADHRTRIRRDVLARLLGPVRVPRPDQE